MSIVSSIEAEYRRYKALAEGAMAQLDDAQLSESGPNGSSSIAVIVWHVAGNLRSRFTDFLDSDGEKPWRHRDEEFEDRIVTRADLTAKWEGGWQPLLSTLAAIGDEDLTRHVSIRGQSLLVYEALHRSLAHTSHHVGQIVYLAKAFRGAQWTTLSIPKGGSPAYNQNPARDRPRAHAASVTPPASPKS